MTTLTNKENLVLSQIKYFQAEYNDGVPYGILKLDLDLSETEIKIILDNLEDKGIISIRDEHIKISKKDLKVDLAMSEKEKGEDELSQKELKAFELIKELADESGLISRHILEGHLLYGELKLSTTGSYNLILSFENKGIIRKVQMADGEYYTI
jgi:hypothetical protein